LSFDGDHHGRGAPRLQDRDQEKVELVAWLVDIGGWSVYRVAHDVVGWSSDLDEDKDRDRAKKQAGRDVAAGRESLRERGVLPWAAFDGDLPDHWWTTSDWLEALVRWQHEGAAAAVRQAVLAPGRAAAAAIDRIAA